MTEEKGKAVHGRRAWRSKGLETSSSTVGRDTKHVSKGECSLSEEPTMYFHFMGVERQCEMLPKSQRGRIVTLGKITANTKMERADWRMPFKESNQGRPLWAVEQEGLRGMAVTVRKKSVCLATGTDRGIWKQWKGRIYFSLEVFFENNSPVECKP